MTKEEIAELIGALPQGLDANEFIYKLVNWAVDIEREKVAKWMMGQGYATGHGDTIEDLFKELEWQVAEREREACAVICDEVANKHARVHYPDLESVADECAGAIRARGIDGAKVGEVGVWGNK